MVYRKPRLVNILHGQIIKLHDFYFIINYYQRRESVYTISCFTYIILTSPMARNWWFRCCVQNRFFLYYVYLFWLMYIQSPQPFKSSYSSFSSTATTATITLLTISLYRIRIHVNRNCNDYKTEFSQKGK